MPVQVSDGLIAALEDPVIDVRERVVETLGIVGDERAIFPLRRLVTEPGHESGTMLPELARLAIRQIRERSRKRGRQWDAAAEGQEPTASTGNS
jgi:HEAT repeat protein